jgi:tRNA 2-thiouridine synthesizing protein E
MLEVAELKLETDKEGYLKNLDDWNESVAIEIARAENISLSPSHWEIIRSLRIFYQRHQIAPANRALVSLVKKEFGADKGRSAYLMRLFQGSPAKTAAKIAGLPRPDNCL